jgi:Ca-activated chloride channel family protein
VDDPLTGRHFVKVKIDMDMETLNQIAAATGTGKASLATNTDELSEIVRKIDTLEKTKFKMKNYYTYREMFMYLLLLAVILSILQFLLIYFIRRELP